MLTDRSKQIRRDTFALSSANGGYHYGGCFSAVEILLVLYDYILTPTDRFVLSKGHACWPWYVLLREKGFTPKLEGHPKRDSHNGVLCSTGSLGHGLPVGIGMALAKRQHGAEGRVYVLMGDGECQEGTTWESLLIATQWNLSNLVVIVDYNGIQGSGFTKDILSLEGLINIADFLGWTAFDVDGHSVDELLDTLQAAGDPINDKSKAPSPVMIIARTVKGKGVSFMEGKPEWHAKWPDGEQVKQMLEELT